MKLRFKLSFFVLTIQAFIVLFQLNSFVIHPIHGKENSNSLPEATQSPEAANSPRWWQMEYDRQRLALEEWAEAAKKEIKLAQEMNTYGMVGLKPPETPTLPPATTTTTPAADASKAMQNNSLALLFKLLASFNVQHENMLRMLANLEQNLNNKLTALGNRIDSIESQTQINLRNCKKLLQSDNMTEPNLSNIKAGWSRYFLKPEAANSNSNTCLNCGAKLLQKVDQLSKNMSAVVGKTAAIYNLTLSTPTHENVSQLADEAKSFIATMFFQLAAEWAKRSNNSNSSGDPVARDCLERQQQLQSVLSNWTAETAASQSGIHQIWPDRSPAPFMVQCDFATSNGGWTVIHSRSDSGLGFFRDWNDFKRGFGNINADHWLGLEQIHCITNQAVYELLVQLENFEGEQVWARYSAFVIGSEAEHYQMKVLGQFEDGGAGDSLGYHAGMKFSTRDRDNDLWAEDNCANEHMGGWWYNSCETANLNGLYLNGFEGGTGYRGMFWSEWMGPEYSLKKASLKIRPLKVK